MTMKTASLLPILVVASTLICCVQGNAFVRHHQQCPPSNLFGITTSLRGGANDIDGTATRTDYNITQEDLELLENELKHCNGDIIDAHLHTSPWFNNGEELSDGLAENNISIGLLYDPYPKVGLPYDVNTKVHSIASSSNGKVFCLASLNTTHDNWQDHRDAELDRLRSFLSKKDGYVLGVKLAPPHTCLPLTSNIIGDIVETVHIHDGNNKVIATHIGTTPFCGPLGKQFGITCLCGDEYVNPRHLERYIAKYPDITFALLHSGHEFLPPGDDCYHNFKYTDECIALAKKYPNVYLSISAIFAQHPDGTLKYPGGFETVRKMKEAGIVHKVFWGSDQAFHKASIKPALIVSIKAMVEAGFTQEERTWTLSGCTRKVFRF